MEPIITVVIPCFNSEKYIQGTIDHLFQQTFKNFEIVVVDDGSTDKTRAVLMEYGNRIRVVDSPHQGASGARTLGVKVAKGSCIQFLDHDDWLANDALEKKWMAMCDDHADVVYSGYQRINDNDDGTMTPGRIVIQPMEDVSLDCEVAAFNGFWALNSALYKKELIEKIGYFNDKLRIIQDVRLFFDAVLNQAKFVFVPDILAYYRIFENKTSLSSSDPMAFIKDIYVNTKDVQEIWLGRGVLSEERKRALLANYAQVTRGSFGKDQDLFEKAYRDMQGLAPGFVPKGSVYFNVLARCFGYRSAERLAFHARKTKQILKEWRD